MSKFKIGDKVRVIKGKRFHSLGDKNFDEFLKENNNVLTIAFVNNCGAWYEVKEDREWCLEEEELELITNIKPTKQELLDMPVGTKIYTDAEDEDYQIWTKTAKKDFYDKNNNNIDNSDINDDLTLDTDEDFGAKIIKIEKPTYETVYDCEEEVQEMTIAEIEKALGHAVKIIKED